MSVVGVTARRALYVATSVHQIEYMRSITLIASLTAISFAILSARSVPEVVMIFPELFISHK